MKFTDRELWIGTAAVLGTLVLKGTYELIRDHYRDKDRSCKDKYDDDEETTTDKILSVI